MNVLIVGTGVIGTLYGCALAEQHDVTHLVRPHKLQAMDGKQISYDLIDERKDKRRDPQGSYTYRCMDRAADGYDLIIVPVKTQQLPDTLCLLKAQAPGAKFLIFTLDWNTAAGLDAVLGEGQYIFGYAGGGGTFRGDLLWANVGADIMLGALGEAQQPLLAQTVSMFKSCGIVPEIPENPLHWLWIHNVGSAPLGAALATYRDMGRLLGDKALLRTSFLAMRECYQICQRRGVPLKKYREVQMMSMPLFLLIPMFRRNFTKNPVMQRFTAHAVDSIDEMVGNFRDIYRTGCDLAVEMPNMQRLMEALPS